MNSIKMKHFIVIFGVLLAAVHSVYSCRCVEPGKCDAVCGSDGVTYGSECLLFCQSLVVPYCLTIVHKGPCKKPKCNCKEKGECKYVCGSDGVTYGNICTLKCARKFNKHLKKIKDGKCGECICPEVYQPVCGTDGKTYGNDCELKCAQELNPKLKKDYSGECKCPWEKSTFQSTFTSTSTKSAHH